MRPRSVRCSRRSRPARRGAASPRPRAGAVRVPSSSQWPGVGSPGPPSTRRGRACSVMSKANVPSSSAHPRQLLLGARLRIGDGLREVADVVDRQVARRRPRLDDRGRRGIAHVDQVHLAGGVPARQRHVRADLRRLGVGDVVDAEPRGVGHVHRVAAWREPDPDRAAGKHDRSNAVDYWNLRRLRRPRRPRARQLRRSRAARRRARPSSVSACRCASRAPSAKPRASSQELKAPADAAAARRLRDRHAGQQQAGPAAPSEPDRVGGADRLAAELGQRDGDSPARRGAARSRRASRPARRRRPDSRCRAPSRGRPDRPRAAPGRARRAPARTPAAPAPSAAGRRRGGRRSTASPPARARPSASPRSA